MQKRTVSTDSTYNLRKNPLNMRNADGSDLILSRVDRLSEMASSDKVSSQNNFLPSIDPPQKNINQKPSFSSTSSAASHFSLSSETDCTSNNVSERNASPSPNLPFSAIMSYNEKKQQQQLQQQQSSSSLLNHQNKSTEILSALPDVADSEDDALSKPAASPNSALETPRKVSNNYKNFAPGGTPGQSDTKIDDSSFLPLEISFANEDFSSLILKDFSRTAFSFTSPPMSAGSQVSNASSLGRKNTITLRGSSTPAAQSQTPSNVFERMRSVRVSTARSVSGASSLVASENQDPKTPVTTSSAAASLVDPTPLFDSVHLGRGQSNSSNFTTWSSSTSSSKHEAPGKSRPPALTKYANSPGRSVSSSSSTSSSSFDSHIAAQLCSIPSPVLNAITFTPPMGAVIVSGEDNEDVDEISMLSHSTEAVLGREKSLRVESKEPVQEEEQEQDTKKDEETEEDVEKSAEEAESTSGGIDPEDRGRLFVRVEGLQNLQLPILSHRNPRFNMNLDNGIQSVTIDSLPITATNPGVNQEFELVVGEDLQFILTFQAFQDPMKATTKTEEELKAEREKERLEKLKETEEERRKLLLKEHEEKIRLEQAMAESTITPQGSPKKQSKFRSMFSSPKKKHSAAVSAANEQGLSQNAAKSTATTRAIQNTANMRTSKAPKLNPPQSASSKASALTKKPKDIWEGLVGPHGEFGRCYLVESQYEKEVYGRSRTFNLTLYNEWGYKEVSTFNSKEDGAKSSGSSVTSSESGNLFSHAGSTANGLITKKVPIEPYKIATLQITFMYIPRATMTGKLPPSMKAATRELALMKTYKNISLDGYLSQEGGDCNYWRRRWFTLRGAEIVGHTEDTKKVRNVLNLGNVESIVDVDQMSPQDKREMMASCLYYDRAFRMTFKDGEVITFYADSIDSKDAWVEALNISVTYCTGRSYEWTDVIIGYHEYEKVKLAEQRASKNEKKIVAIKA